MRLWISACGIESTTFIALSKRLNAPGPSIISGLDFMDSIMPQPEHCPGLVIVQSHTKGAGNVVGLLRGGLNDGIKEGK